MNAYRNVTYNFRIADLDGNNKIQRSLQKLSYPAKNFGYYSIVNDQFLTANQQKTVGDLCFQQYVSFYQLSVTSVLTNDSVQSVKAYPVNDVTTATGIPGYGYSFDNNLIGYDWKSFNGSTFIIELVAYFVIDKTIINGKWYSPDLWLC